MANEFKPSVHQWYLRPGKDELFRIVAVDDGTIEIQRFDGDVEELDLDAWRGLDIELVEPPEDWTGPFDNIEADELDDTQSAMRKGDGQSRVESQFRAGEAWQEAPVTDEPEEEGPRILGAAATDGTGESPMEDRQPKDAAAAKTAMLIRRPVAEVFRAFIDPAITTKFWFTKSTGPLEAGKQIEWIWEMYDQSTRVTARTIEPNRRIVIEWDGYSGRTLVEWKFAPQKDGSTFVSITESGWTGSADDLLKYVANSTQGFTWTLAGLKALLEHGIQLNLVADRFPKGIDEP